MDGDDDEAALAGESTEALAARYWTLDRTLSMAVAQGVSPDELAPSFRTYYALRDELTRRGGIPPRP